MDVRDVADGAIKACKFGRSGQCYILSNQFFTIRDFLNQIAEISGKKKNLSRSAHGSGKSHSAAVGNLL